MHSTLPGFGAELLVALQAVYGRLPFSSIGSTSIPAGASMPIRPSEKHTTITSPSDVLIIAPSPGLRVSLSIEASLQDLIPWLGETCLTTQLNDSETGTLQARRSYVAASPCNDALL